MHLVYAWPVARFTALAALAVVLLGSIVSAQHGQPKINPNTSEGIALIRIQQEKDVENRIELLRGFAAAYPKPRTLLWVLESLPAAYFHETRSTRRLRSDSARWRSIPATSTRRRTA